MRVLVVLYDPNWPRVFQTLCVDLLAILQPIILEVTIEHVGSTSVPGLSAKPIIDMDVIVSAEEYPLASSLLSQNGYTFNPEPTGIDRMSFRWDGHTHDQGATRPTEDGKPRRMVYLVKPDATSLANHLAVRDVLRQDAELRKEYGDLKLSLANHEWEHIGKYGGAKSELITRIMKKSGLSDETMMEIKERNSRELKGKFATLSSVDPIGAVATTA